METYIAFEGSRHIASGDLVAVAVAAKSVLDRSGEASVLIFDQQTSQLAEIDFRGTPEDVRARLSHPPAAAPLRGPGRPKLGVVAREVTLLPRHWDWLNGQPGGASVALRKLIDNARKTNGGKDLRRKAQESAYRFLTVMAGNEAGFEEALRALFAGKRQRFEECTESWPPDIRAHAFQLALPAMADPSDFSCANGEVSD